jgi:hypothetical protein
MRRIGFSTAGALLLLLAATHSRADVLEFATPNICSNNTDGSGPAVACNSYGYINQGYGDSATANVTYIDGNNPGTTLRWWPAGYSDMQAALWASYSATGSGSSWAEIAITPLSGVGGITLNSFNLGWYGNSLNTNVQILDALTNAVLLDYGQLALTPGAPALVFNPNIGSANGIVISFRDQAYDIGIDNIDFTPGLAPAGVPEPGSWSLLGAGLGACVWLARRRASASLT